MTTSDLSLRSGPQLAAQSFAIDAPGDLLDYYTPDGFVWSDGDNGFVAAGVAAVVEPEHAVAFLDTIDHVVAAGVSGHAGPRAVGALPFRGSGQLVVPALIVGRNTDGTAWRTEIEPVDIPPVVHSIDESAPSRFGIVAATTRAEWCAMVDRALVDIERGGVEKVVLARAVTVDSDLPFDVRAVLAFLRRSQPGCVVYADRGYVGASPELLVRKVGRNVTSRPLAGTGVDTAALVRSAKDAHEHRLVVDSVVRALRGCCADVRAEGPAPLELADVSHLATTVTAHTESAATSVTDIVAALHPTPAVAGVPREVAIDTIDAIEPTPRGRYAGPCGWVDANGDGEFVVALRGGEIDGTHALIHAGAGIVCGSNPEAEWTETQQKLTPMLQALVRP